MTATVDAVVGRDSELIAVDSFLDRADASFAALVVEGEAGIGKSTLWREGVRRAVDRGFVVLACRAAASETSLSHAAVADLLDGVPSSAWVSLPARQRHALEVVTFRAEPGKQLVEAGTIAAGLRSLVEGFAEESPVLLAVDDVQWLDEASVAVLAHVLRRLWSNRVGVLVARRLAEPPTLDLDGLVPDQSLARLVVEPLSFGALRLMLRARLGTEFSRSLLWRVHRAAQGNPLFALEIGRTLVDRGAPGPDEPLPVPDDVHELVGQRVSELPAATTTLLLGAALMTAPTVEALGRATGRDVEPDLKPARECGIADRVHGRVAFGHPLHAEAIVGMSSGAARRSMHARLAEAVRTPEHRARHLWLAARGADQATADALHEAAELAIGRGATRDAAENFDRARQLTPEEQAGLGRSRAVRAADLYLQGGDRASAEALLDALSSDAALGRADAAEVLRLRALIHWSDNEPARAEQALEQACTHDPGNIRVRLGQVVVAAEGGDHRRSVAIADQLVHDLDECSEASVLAEVLANSAMARCVAGEGIDWSGIRRAVELDPDAGSLTGVSPRPVLGYLTMYAGKLVEARQLLTAVRDELAERGIRDGFIQDWLSGVEWRCGNFRAAAAHLDEGIACTEVTGNVAMRAYLMAELAFVDIHRGDLAAIRTQLDAMTEDPGRAADTAMWLVRAAAVGRLAIGDHDAAWEACRPLVEEVEISGIPEPNKALYVPYAIEALVGTGQLDRATSLIDLWETRARALDYEWALGFSARGRALLALAQGDMAPARTAAAEAVDLHARTDMMFERARDVLVLGIAERRSRQWGAARHALESAVAEFDRLGTPAWAERARDELARAGSASAASSGLLTASEDRVTRLAIEGHGNKEIAALLSMSVHTVDRHLSNAYRKLGISRRSQLAAALRGEDVGAAPSA